MTFPRQGKRLVVFDSVAVCLRAANATSGHRVRKVATAVANANRPQRVGVESKPVENIEPVILAANIGEHNTNAIDNDDVNACQPRQRRPVTCVRQSKLQSPLIQHRHQMNRCPVPQHSHQKNQRYPTHQCYQAFRSRARVSAQPMSANIFANLCVIVRAVTSRSG